MLTTYQGEGYRAPFWASVLLILTLIQGSSFTLTIAFKGPYASDLLITLVTMGWLFMYAMAVIGLFASFGINWATWLVRYRLLLTCLVAGAAFSTAWSVDTELTLERSIHLIGTTLVALYLGFSLPLHRILKTSAIVLGLLMVASAIVAYKIPALGLIDYEGTPVWSGVLASKNTLGFWSAITLLLLISLCFWSISTTLRLSYLVLAAFAALCLYHTVSATSLLALITAGLIMIYMHAAFSLRLGLTSMIVLAVLVAGLVGIAFHFIDTAELIGRSGDLTGRVEVWAQTWQLILDRPLTGFGYGTIWYPTDDTVWIQKQLTDFSWTVYHAHNGLLQIASEIGLPLAGLTLFMITQQLVEIVYCQYQRQLPGVLFVLGYCVALLISNYSEARLLVNRELYWILFIALPVSMLQQITLVTNHAQLNGQPGALPSANSAKLRASLDKLIHKRRVKDRIKKRSSVKVINASTDNSHSVISEDTRRQDIASNQSRQQTPRPLPDADSQTEPEHMVKANSLIEQTDNLLNRPDDTPSIRSRIARWRKKAG